MAVRGDSITRDKLFDGWDTKTLAHKSAYYYINATSFKFYVDCDSYWSWFVTYYNSVHVIARYYNGSTWVERFDLTIDGRKDYDSISFKHNTTDSIYEDSTYYKSSDDATSKYYHLWCFQVSIGGNSPKSFEGFISTGTLNSPSTTQAMYDDIMKGRKIYGNGPLTTSIYESVSDGSAALAYFDSNNNRGTLIYPQHNKYMIPKGGK